MWTLAQALSHVSSRVGEASVTFWSKSDRVQAVNDAQRFIAAVTNGVPLTTTGTVSVVAPYLEIAGNITGTHGSSGLVDNQVALNVVRSDVADRVAPGWRVAASHGGPPRWVVLDMATNRAYLTPLPNDNVPVSVTVAVIPPDLEMDSDALFAGATSMSKYLGALTNYAAAMLLLRERFDGDAERFFQLAMQELKEVGVDPTAIPPLPVAAQE